jgi:hypothetical protein
MKDMTQVPTRELVTDWRAKTDWLSAQITSGAIARSVRLELKAIERELESRPIEESARAVLCR